MEKINVPELNVGEKMFISKKCVVIFNHGSERTAQIYNFKGEILGKIPNVFFDVDVRRNTFFAENTFGFRNQSGAYCIKDYDGNVIQTISKYKALIVRELEALCQYEEKSFFEEFREREIAAHPTKAIYGCKELQDGTKIWISPHYLIVKTEKNEMKIYFRDFEKLRLLGTIPESNFKNDEIFQTIIKNNCHWYGLDHNMLIKEKDGWKIVTQSGETVVDKINDELIKIFTEGDSKKTDNSDEKELKCNGILVKNGEMVEKDPKVFIVREENGKVFRVYSTTGILVARVPAKESYRIIETEQWVAIRMVESVVPYWQIFDYNGKGLYREIRRILKINQMYFAEAVVDYLPYEEMLLVFSSEGEEKASIIGEKFEYNGDSDYIKVYKDSDLFEIYDYNGKKLFDTTFNKKTDILGEDIIIHKNEEGGYTEYDLKAMEKYNIDCQEIKPVEDFENLTIIIRKNGHCGLFECVKKHLNDFKHLAQLIPSQYDEITADDYYFYARYSDNQSVFEDIYDNFGNFVMKVKV